MAYDAQLGFLVMTEDNCSIDAVLPSSVEKEVVTDDIFKFSTDSDWDAAIAIERLEADGCVKYLEPNRVIERLSEPNDNYYQNEDMWGMGGVSETADRTASSSNSRYGSNAIGAWDQGYTGSRDVVVAVIDEGFDLDHPDLMNNLWVNSGEIAGDGLDNDANGIVDDIHGYDACYDDGNPDSDDVNEFHGTHVAGTIGAEGNNDYGVVGVNWNVSLMSIKIIDNSQNCGTQADLLRAYQYVIDQRNAGVNLVVTNNSYGTSGVYFDPIEQNKINEMGDAGVLYVGAAGNSANDNDLGYGAPSNYTCESELRDWDCIIAVGSIDKDGSYSGFSNFGVSTVDLAAPGSGILSTTTPFDSPDLSSYVLMDFPSNSSKYGYEFLSGTSMATPHVTGAVALCSSVNPSLDGGQLRNAILDNAEVLGSLNNRVASSGILNTGDAVNDCATAPGGVNAISVSNSTSTGFDVGWTGFSQAMTNTANTISMQIRAVGQGNFANVESGDCSGELAINGGSCTLENLSEQTAYDVRLVVDDVDAESKSVLTYATTSSVSGKQFQFVQLGEIPDTLQDQVISLPTETSAGLAISYSVTGSCVLENGNELTFTEEGNCQVTASEPGDDVYEAAASVTRSFSSFTKQNQTITFENISSQTTPGTVSLNASSSSGLAVTYKASGDCTLAGSLASFNTTGSCQLTAYQPGNTYFFPAAPVSRSFAIAEAPAPAPTPPSSGGGVGGGFVGSSPELVRTPEVSGVNSRGQILTVSSGEWDQSHYEISYQWYACEEELTVPTQLQVLLSCELIPGVTTNELLVTEDYEGSFILASAVASDGFYSTTAFTETIGPGASKGEIEQTPPTDAATETGYWTKRNGDNVKIYAKNIVGVGKVQLFMNGEEIAWIRASDNTDPKLRVITEGHMRGAVYLVRDRDLLPGKNVFEIYVDGQRVERRIATG